MSVQIAALVNMHILGVVAKLRKATTSFVMSLCPLVRTSIRMEQLGPHWTNFHEIWCLSIYSKIIRKIKVLLKYDKNNGYFSWRPVHIYDNISLNSCYNEKFFKVTEKAKNTFWTQYLFSPQLVPLVR